MMKKQIEIRMQQNCTEPNTVYKQPKNMRLLGVYCQRPPLGRDVKHHGRPILNVQDFMPRGSFQVSVVSSQHN